MGREGRAQGRSCPAVATPHGACGYLWRLLHLQEHGTRSDVSRHRAEIPDQDPNHRILARQRSRFTHYYFYIRDEALGPIVMQVASFFPFQTCYYLNGHSFIEQELKRAQIGFRKTDNAFLAVDDVAALQAAADKLKSGHHPQTARLLDPDPGAEVLSQGTQAAQSVTLLCDRPDRVLPQLHLQAPLPDPQAVR